MRPEREGRRQGSAGGCHGRPGCCDRHRAELEEEPIDGGNELDSIARKEGFVLIKEPGTGAGVVAEAMPSTSGALLHFFKDATLKHLKSR